MDATAIMTLVAALDVTRSSEEEAAWEQLRELGQAVVPYLAEAYPRFRTWQGRCSLVYHSVRYARVSDESFRLGVQALRDRSYMVRYRACMLLAYSLRADALEQLRLLVKHSDVRTRGDAAAAIDAIEERNHHLFVDRDHSGRAKLVVNDEDRE